VVLVNDTYAYRFLAENRHSVEKLGQVGAASAVQGSNIGLTLRQRPAAVILGQGLCKTLFIHAGLPLQLLLSLVQGLSKPEPDAILAKLNEIMTGMCGCVCLALMQTA